MLNSKNVKNYPLPVGFESKGKNYFYGCNNFGTWSNGSPEGFLNITDAFSKLVPIGFYYSFNINGEHSHEHEFDTVVQRLYEYPNTFNILKKDYEFYSNQELEYLKELQYYLNFLMLKDIDGKNYYSRLKTSRIKKYSACKFYFSKYADKIISGDIKYDLKTFEYDNNIFILAMNTTDYKGLIKITTKEFKLNELDEKYLEYNEKGFNNPQEYLDTISKNIKNNTIYVLEYEVIEKF